MSRKVAVSDDDPLVLALQDMATARGLFRNASPFVEDAAGKAALNHFDLFPPPGLRNQLS